MLQTVFYYYEGRQHPAVAGIEKGLALVMVVFIRPVPF